MNKIKKIALIFFICLLNILLITLSQTYPISISLNTATFFQIPVFFWLVMIASPFLLYFISKISKNKFVPILCAMFYYFIFFSYGLYFLSHPTITDIGSSTFFQEQLAYITHIGASEIEIQPYFQWPIYFIFSKMFSSILGISTIFTLNLGFMSLISIFPIFIILFYKSREISPSISNYFIVPALYLILAFPFLNDQFVPQFLSLIYLIITFGCFAKYRETKSRLFFILIIIFYIFTVFSHAFMFIFFVISIILEKIWEEYVEKKKKSVISYEMILLILIIPITYLSVYLTKLKSAPFGESWRIFDYVFSQTTPGGNGIQIQPLYQLIPEFYDIFFSNMSKIVVAGAFIIVAIGFILYNLKKREILDFSIMASTFAWFIMGLSKMVLGQRALQVAPLALSSHFKPPHKIFSYFSKIIIVIIIISPSLLVANALINESLIGERLVQDTQENIAGKFLDTHLDNKQYYILTCPNAYPTSLHNDIVKADLLSIKTDFISPKLLDFVVYSPKLKLRSIYMNTSIPRNHQDFVVYKSRNIDIIALRNRIR